MNAIREIVTRITRARKMYGFSYEYAEYTDQKASDIIKAELLAAKPSMICRFGMNELDCVIGYCNPPSFGNYLKYFCSEISSVGWSKGAKEHMANNAGFFPVTSESLSKFSKLMIEEMKFIDILGTWMKQESFFSDRLKQVRRVEIKDLEPFYHTNPWSVALENKRVLVIHPFEESIREQYKKREFLFSDKRVLPCFELQTIKAVQSIADNRSKFKSWFEALDFMKQEISYRDFEIAIIGCGAYGFPLASFVKKMGKKAIHIGGATQLLFGIKGSRWEERPFYQNLFNEHWIKPLAADYPEGYKRVENGCYW